ncbi:Protein N-acetyltransferase, RimJ/RimL family [Haladaptatus litoreus]|uniref:Protein N-acetyltransferase, RimJ/RimL family n=1 Tax=Haladaptatus litoreus TaxID=553468 RepID=A0A1N6WG51_9EURY|nr:GNAT family protein [Haladaptatus litoreus]SIQ88946.1 Protein N-acetyltransferase, RimJ/RimL family [Haladaptatus litoreus]
MPGAATQSSDRITLRTVEKEDVQFVQRAMANSELRYPIGNRLVNQTQLEEHIENDDSDRFLICLEEGEASPEQPNEADVTRIGEVTVMDAEWKRPELGYWLVPEVHGHGYGKEAVSMVIDYTFRQYDTPAIGAEAYDFNDASRGLLESLGFSEEGCRRKFMFIDGEHRDMVQYGLLRDDWCEEK